jgi:hypothetical protein
LGLSDHAAVGHKHDVTEADALFPLLCMGGGIRRFRQLPSNTSIATGQLSGVRSRSQAICKRP